MPDLNFSTFTAYVTISKNSKLQRKEVSKIQAENKEAVERFLESSLNDASKNLKLVKIHRIFKTKSK